MPAEARFSAPVQTGPGAHLTSYTMGTGSLPGVKRLERPLTPNITPSLKYFCCFNRYTFTLLWAFVACSRVNFTFYNQIMSIDTLCVCSFSLILSFFIIFILVCIIRYEQFSMCAHSIPGDGGQAKLVGSVTNTFLIVYFVGIL